MASIILRISVAGHVVREADPRMVAVLRLVEESLTTCHETRASCCAGAVPDRQARRRDRDRGRQRRSRGVGASGTRRSSGCGSAPEHYPRDVRPVDPGHPLVGLLAEGLQELVAAPGRREGDPPPDQPSSNNRAALS
ncbi:hypothetical protein ACTWPB_20725 [Nocardia sp. IBHARD005]|uniref:hypothetical protein n=1 Tax=Nocardia sp. IBHARD005 TaxID=3457765 RepID=UPI004059DCC4